MSEPNSPIIPVHDDVPEDDTAEPADAGVDNPELDDDDELPE